MSSPMLRLRAAEASHPEGSVLDAIEFMVRREDGSFFEEQADNLRAVVEVCLRMEGLGYYSGKLGRADDLRWLYRALGELFDRLRVQTQSCPP